MAFSFSCVVINILMSSVTILYIFYCCRLTNFISFRKKNVIIKVLVTGKVIDSCIPATCTWLTLMKIIKLCRKKRKTKNM